MYNPQACPTRLLVPAIPLPARPAFRVFVPVASPASQFPIAKARPPVKRSQPYDESYLNLLLFSAPPRPHKAKLSQSKLGAAALLVPASLAVYVAHVVHEPLEVAPRAPLYPGAPA